jgi:hypothetical protein
MGPIEKYLKKLESKKILKEDSNIINPEVQAFLDECDRLNKILRDNNLFKKEQQKYQK